MLAGANDPPALPDDSGDFAQLPEDGVLTAEELAFLPLEDVELVVLSACETGLGKVAGGEGLLGMQRAFQVAGARTTVASLWKVDDAMTQQLMTKFYRNVLENKQPYVEALRNAQLEMLKELRDKQAGAAGGDPKRGGQCAGKRSCASGGVAVLLGGIHAVGRLAVRVWAEVVDLDNVRRGVALLDEFSK